MMELVSLIIPVYNVEKYLDRCVASLVKQNYENIEILLVDDASTDGSPAICDAWGARDTRIKVMHIDHIGVSGARNAGLDNCKGEYIAFIDSDDWVTPEYIESFMKRASKDLIVCCGYYLTDGNYFIKYCSKAEMMLDRQQIYYFFMGEGHKHCQGINNDCVRSNVWNKLYPRDIFKTLRFPVGRNFEDLYIDYAIFQQKESILVINKANYYYFQRAGSITKTHNKNNQLDYLAAKLNFEQEMLKENNELYELARKRSLIIALYCLGYESMGDYKLNAEERAYIKRIIKDRGGDSQNLKAELGKRVYYKYMAMQYCSWVYKAFLYGREWLKSICNR